MKKYFSFFWVRFAAALQYRAAAAAGVCTQFAWGFLTLLLYRAFYRADPSAFPMEFSQLSSYVWLQQAFLSLFMLWFLEGDLFDAVTNGGVAYELCRPLSLYGMWFARTAAGRTAKAALRCVPVLAVALLLPQPYGLRLPASPAAFLLFLASLLLGLVIVCALCMLIYGLTFYTMSPSGLRMFATSAVSIFSGELIPLSFLPEGLRQAAELLPFAGIQDFPLRIWNGLFPVEEAAAPLALQLFWAAVLTAAGALLFRRALRRVVVQGG